MIRRGKVLYCLDCDKVLPEMPDWLLLKNEKEDEHLRVKPRKPKSYAQTKFGGRGKNKRNTI